MDGVCLHSKGLLQLSVKVVKYDGIFCQDKLGVLLCKELISLGQFSSPQDVLLDGHHALVNKGVVNAHLNVVQTWNK